MNSRVGVVLVALASACHANGDDADPGDRDVRTTFPTPWEGLEATTQKLKGAFLGQVGEEYPGAGWFEAGAVVGRDVVQVNVLDVGAAWPVVQIRILGHTTEGWNELEIDVALNKFVAGSIPIDGESATGQLVESADGSIRYLLEGELVITQPGIEVGQSVEGEFKGVLLSEKM